MRNIWTIAKREFKHYYDSPLAYVIAFIIFLILGIIFYANLAAASAQQFTGSSYVPSIQVVISPLITILLFSTPAITMRLLADEQRMGTLELLLTAPVRDAELVAGKFLGAFLFMLSLVALTWIFPIILNMLVSPGIDQGLLITGYLGLVLLIGVFIGIGVAISSMFTNPIPAFFATLGVLLILWMIGFPAQAGGGAGSTLLSYLDLSEHFYNSFYTGILELKDILYYLSVIAFALMLGTVSVETRRWR